jgi:hypothetical protein
MRWISFVVGGLVVLVATVVAIGSMLPRTHKASRTLRVKRSPAEVWPVVLQSMQASDVPVDILENQPPHRLVTRVTEKETNFGGTWTIALVALPDGTDLTITEDGWVANPIFRFVSRFVIGHHATLDSMLKRLESTLGQ